MKPTYQLHALSNSTNFLPISVAATSSGSATLLHEADSTNYDEIWLKAFNYSNQDAILYLCIGGVNAHQIMPVPVPAGVGVVPILNGEVYTNGTQIKAYCSNANLVSILGRVNRIVFV